MSRVFRRAAVVVAIFNLVIAAKPALATELSGGKLTTSLSADHFIANPAYNDPYTSLRASVSYEFYPGWIGTFVQPAVKRQVVDRGEPEFAIDDSTVQLTAPLIDDWRGWNWKLQSSLTLPVSDESNRQGMISRPGVSLMIGRKFFSDRLNITYVPFYRYHLNQYTTRIDGKPLKQQALGHALTFSLKAYRDLGVVATVQNSYSWTERDPYGVKNGQAVGGYLYGLSLSYPVTKNIDVGLGYLQSDSFISEGRYEVQLYDPSTSRFYLSLSASI